MRIRGGGLDEQHKLLEDIQNLGDTIVETKKGIEHLSVLYFMKNCLDTTEYIGDTVFNNFSNKFKTIKANVENPT